MAEWIIAGLLGAILLILYVELRVLTRAMDKLDRVLTREMEKLDSKMEKLDRRMEQSTARMAEEVRALRRIVEGEGA